MSGSLSDSSSDKTLRRRNNIVHLLAVSDDPRGGAATGTRVVQVPLPLSPPTSPLRRCRTPLVAVVAVASDATVAADEFDAITFRLSATRVSDDAFVRLS